MLTDKRLNEFYQMAKHWQLCTDMNCDVETCRAGQVILVLVAEVERLQELVPVREG